MTIFFVKKKDDIAKNFAGVATLILKSRKKIWNSVFPLIFLFNQNLDAHGICDHNIPILIQWDSSKLSFYGLILVWPQSMS